MSSFITVMEKMGRKRICQLWHHPTCAQAWGTSVMAVDCYDASLKGWELFCLHPIFKLETSSWMFFLSSCSNRIKLLYMYAIHFRYNLISKWLVTECRNCVSDVWYLFLCLFIFFYVFSRENYHTLSFFPLYLHYLYLAVCKVTDSKLFPHPINSLPWHNIDFPLIVL